MSGQQPMPGAPKEIDRADVLGELNHRFERANPNNAVAWVLDELIELDILKNRETALCGVPEGMTGIDCQLPKGHVLPDGSLRVVHEGTTTAEQAAYVGYEVFVRWPAQVTASESVRSPRLFYAGGPPPPPAVTFVEHVGYDSHGHRYYRRSRVHAFLWVPAKSRDDNLAEAGLTEWPPADGVFREVQS